MRSSPEIARLSFPLAGYRRVEFGCSSEKLTPEAEQLELVLETVEADQAERLAAASPTVAAAGVEGLVDGNSVRFSAIRFCQIDLLSRPEDDPLPGFNVPRYRPQAESHVERIDAYGAPECKFTELVLQRVTVAAERYGIAIRRLHSGATVRSRANMRRFRGSCSTTDHARKLSDKGQVLHALPEVRPRLGAGHGTGNAGCRQNVADQGAISRLAYSAAFSASLPGGIRSSFVAQIFSITRSMK
jgi:hypothetical protein